MARPSRARVVAWVPRMGPSSSARAWPRWAVASPWRLRLSGLPPLLVLSASAAPGVVRFHPGAVGGCGSDREAGQGSTHETAAGVRPVQCVESSWLIAGTRIAGLWEVKPRRVTTVGALRFLAGPYTASQPGISRNCLVPCCREYMRRVSRVFPAEYLGPGVPGRCAWSPAWPSSARSLRLVVFACRPGGLVVFARRCKHAYRFAVATASLGAVLPLDA